MQPAKHVGNGKPGVLENGLNARHVPRTGMPVVGLRTLPASGNPPLRMVTTTKRRTQGQRPQESRKTSLRHNMHEVFPRILILYHLSNSRALLNLPHQ